MIRAGVLLLIIAFPTSSFAIDANKNKDFWFKCPGPACPSVRDQTDFVYREQSSNSDSDNSFQSEGSGGVYD